MPRVGSVVLATDQGLGYLARDFYNNGVISKVLVRKHSNRPNHTDWYSDWKWLAKENYDWFLEGLDSVLFFETPFDFELVKEAKKRGIKTVLMVMYECTPPLPVKFDLVLSPSELDKQYFPNSLLCKVPVDVEWRKREHAITFVHNAGNGGLGGRNGTREFLDSLKFVKSPARFIIRSQIPLPPISDKRVDVRVGQFDDIWSEGDVFVFPEKFNGLSLPLQEAFASGMLVMCGNRFPMNTWLPTAPMVPVQQVIKDRIAVPIDVAVYNPKDIAKTIDSWFGRGISHYSYLGKKWAEQNTWRKLKETYAAFLSA